MEYAVDFGIPEGQYILAARDGKVIRIQENKTDCGGNDKVNEGNYVVIQHDSFESSLYLHLQKVCVSNGQEVKQGQVIGLSGKTAYYRKKVKGLLYLKNCMIN
jgi:murein DD-endopeptidase MepM/ murein hydrolase activator NlpD